MDDPQYQALESIITVDDPELGPLKMQNVLFRLSETPGEVRWSGPRLGEHNEEVYGELGVDEERLRSSPRRAWCEDARPANPQLSLRARR